MMKKQSYYIVIFIFCGLLSGCGLLPDSPKKQLALEHVNMDALSAGITVNISASTKLNQYQQLASSCPLLVIQSSSEADLRKILKSPIQLQTLFSGGSVKGILQTDRYSISPGEKTTLHIDRVQNSQYVAIVVGYYPFPEPSQILVYKIPINTYTSGFFIRSWHAELAAMTINLWLGSNNITRANYQV